MAPSISWNWKVPFQSLDLCGAVGEKLIDQLNPENCSRRAAGLSIVLISGGAAIALGIALIAEPLIKGLGNILGCCCKKKCTFANGVTFLIITPIMPAFVALLSPLAALAFAISLVSIPIWAAIAPDNLRDIFVKVRNFNALPA